MAAFYAGKTVTIVVGGSPGGGFDAYARLIGNHIGKHIPGAPNIVVENMSGAGTRIATNHVYNVAPQDGTVIGSIAAATIALGQLFGDESVEADVTQFTHLGAPVFSPYMMVVRKEAAITNFDELLAADADELVVGATAPGDTTHSAPTLLAEVLGANIRVVQGYPGTAEIRLALERGEVNGMFHSWTALKNAAQDKIDSGDWLLLAQMTDEPPDDLPGEVPTISELTDNAEHQQVLRYATSVPDEFNRDFVLGPNVPDDRGQALRAAFAATMTDPAFLEEAESAGLDIDAISGERVTELIQEFMGMPDEIKDQLQPVLGL